MRKILVMAMFFIVVCTSGCASIVSDSEYPVTFNSVPSGATVTVENENGIQVARQVTPFTTTLQASDGYFDRMSYAATFDKACYESTAVALKGGVDLWYWGNLLFGGPIGLLIVDPATGSMFKLNSSSKVVLNRSPNDADCRGGDQRTAAVEVPLRAP